jgi:SAM-dependent methyltransferase
MTADPVGPYRIYPEEPTSALAGLDPHTVAVHELLRPLGPKPEGRELEPFTRGWYEELEIKRYTPHGDWLRRSLEFCRHKHEEMLMFGPGAGSDALQYHRHGTHVTLALTPADSQELVQRNFELRGLQTPTIHLNADGTIPTESGRFDLAYLNLLYTPPENLAQRVAEIHRALKANGKLFVLAPARYDAGFWQRFLTPWWIWTVGDGHLTDTHRYSARELRRTFPQFHDSDIAQRHLRRSELPYLWRSFPLNLLQRFMGRILIYKGFKPLLEVASPSPLRTAA